MEQPLPSNVTCSAGIEPLWIETQNYHAPPLEGIETALQRIEEVLRSGEGGIVVHCAGGKGRAGTLLACYMCKWGLEVPPVNGEWCGQGMNAGDAIKLLRKTVCYSAYCDFPHAALLIDGACSVLEVSNQ